MYITMFVYDCNMIHTRYNDNSMYMGYFELLQLLSHDCYKTQYIHVAIDTSADYNMNATI